MREPGFPFPLLLLSLYLLTILVVPGMAVYTTELTVRRLSADGLTPINETTVGYEWLEDNLPIQGDGSTYYYFQGPIFPDEWNNTYYGRYIYSGNPDFSDWNSSEEKWDRVWNGTAYVQMEECNVLGKNLGKLKGTDVKDLCNLVGGLPVGSKVNITAVDNFAKTLPYSAIYTPTPGLGPYVITWYSDDAGESGYTKGYTGPDYPAGMRATFMGDTSRNPWGKNVSGLGDMYEGMPSSYYYYYKSGGISYPSAGGYTIKYVRYIDVLTDDPQPAPTADFSAKIKTDRITNGGFESLLSGWTTQGNVITTSTRESGTYGVMLNATLDHPANISQQVDLTGISSLRFWGKLYSAPKKYFEVLFDGEAVAYPVGVGVTPGLTPVVYVIDVSGYTGTHTFTFNAVNDDETSARTTGYLDNIEAMVDGTSGPVPLTVQFADLSIKMENPYGRSWKWDFNNDGTVDSTVMNPSYTYSTPGTYTVNLTVTTPGGSDTEIKTDYITVLGPPPVANFSGRINTTFNGGFETGNLSGWTATGRASIQTGQKHSGSYAVNINTTSGVTQSSVSQSVNLTNVSQISYYSYISVTTTGNLTVLIDGAQNERYNSPVSTWTHHTIDTSSYSGLHTIRFEVNRGDSGTKNILAYLDDIETMSQPPGSIYGSPPLTVYFNDTSTNSPTSWFWTFGDGGTSTEQNPVHTYTGSNLYPVSLNATNANGSDIETKTAYVVTGTPSSPVADFSANITSGMAPLPVKFTDLSTNIPTSWQWAYKNATGNWTIFATTQNPEYTFPAGTYDINLTATNSGGSDDEIKTGFIVSELVEIPDANFTATPRNGTAPLTVQFNDTSTNTPTSWKWAYKNTSGTWTQFATTQNPEYTFPAGVYDINLTATNAAGSNDEIKIAYINATSYTPYIDIDISGSIDTWNFQTGTNEDNESVDLTVDTNMASWTVTVHDAMNSGKPAGTEGKMAEWSSISGYIASGEFLENALKVKSGDETYVTLSGDPQDLQSGTDQGILPFDITFRQDVAETDPALENGHQYHIVVTFTGGTA